MKSSCFSFIWVKISSISITGMFLPSFIHSKVNIQIIHADHYVWGFSNPSSGHDIQFVSVSPLSRFHRLSCFDTETGGTDREFRDGGRGIWNRSNRVAVSLEFDIPFSEWRNERGRDLESFIQCWCGAMDIATPVHTTGILLGSKARHWRQMVRLLLERLQCMSIT